MNSGVTYEFHEKNWKYQESQESWIPFLLLQSQLMEEILKQPPGMCKKPVNNGISTTNLDWLAGFLNHEQYHHKTIGNCGSPAKSQWYKTIVLPCHFIQTLHQLRRGP